MSDEPRRPFDFDDEGDDLASESERRYPNPPRPTPPIFAPVVFDDDADYDDEQRRPRAFADDEEDGYASDTSLVRVLGIIVVLGLVIIALVLPWSPISIVGGGGGAQAEGITHTVRDDMPAVPAGLVAMSRLYDIAVDDGIAGPLRVEIRLNQATQDPADLGYYTWDGSRWTRLGDVDLRPGGSAVAGTIPAQSISIAVMRRTAQAHTLGLIVEAGETPDPQGLAHADTVVVMAGTLSTAEGAPTITGPEAALRPALDVSGGRAVLLGIRGFVESPLLDPAAGGPEHIERIVAAVGAYSAAGVALEYAVTTADRDRFTAFVEALHERLAGAGLRLVVIVPASEFTRPGAEPSAYRWSALQEVSDAVWVRVAIDPVLFHNEVDGLLATSQAAGVDATRLSIVVDRRSALVVGEALAEPITLLQALTAASGVDYNVGAIGPGTPVSLRTSRLGGGAQGLRWDDNARAVSFTFVEQDVERTVRIQNAFSLGFQLDAAQRAGFGGVAVASAGEVAVHPDVWQVVGGFVQDGVVRLQRPFGPYLTPCWEAHDGAIEGQPACWTEETDTSAVVWRAPSSEGAYTVRLIVSDGTAFVAQEVVLRVGASAPPEPTPTAEPTATATPEATGTPASTPAPEETATPEPTASAPLEEEDDEEEATPGPTPDPTPVPPVEGTPPGPAGAG